MKKYSVMFASMLAAVSLAAFAAEPQGKAGQQTLKAPIQMSEAEMDNVVAGDHVTICASHLGCFTFNVPDRLVDVLHHALQPQHHGRHHH